MEEIKFKQGDYIINRSGGDMGVFDKLDKKGYMHFKMFYGGMLKYFKDVKTYTLQINYQKFFDLCSEEEKNKLDKLYAEYKQKGE